MGNPIKALKVPLSNFLPGNDFNPIIAAMGMLQIADKQTANPDTISDRKTIRYTNGSREKISWKAWIIPSTIEVVVT